MTQLDPETNARLQQSLTELKKAIWSSNLVTMQQILDAHPNLVHAWDESRFCQSGTALHVAVVQNSSESVQVLLRNGADIHYKDSMGRTPLHKAAEFWHLPVIQVLLDHGADPEARDDYGSASLHLIYLRSAGKKDWVSQEQATEVLLNSGADPNSRDQDGSRLLHLVGRSVGSAVALLAAGADIEARDNAGCTPLHRAALHSDDVIKVLLEHGADVHARDVDGWTPLHYAAFRYSPNGHYIPYLLEAGADPNVRDYEGQTPLHVAAANHCIREARLLLEAGADLQARDGEGKTPLYRAQRGPLLTDDPEYTPRTEAFKIGRREMVEFLKSVSEGKFLPGSERPGY